MKVNQRKDYQVTPVRMPPDIKRRVRVIAAENDTTMADMMQKFVSMGLAEYETSLKRQKKPNEVTA